jgi:hypothetical protein
VREQDEAREKHKHDRYTLNRDVHVFRIIRYIPNPKGVTMNNQINIRLQISGLFLVAFLGLVMHVLMFSFETSMSLSELMVQMNTENTDVNAETLQTLGDIVEETSGMPMAAMMFGFVVLSLMIVVLPLVSEHRATRWATAILGALLGLMNILDGVVHAAEDQVLNGLYTLLISGGIGVWGVILAFKWIKMKGVNP